MWEGADRVQFRTSSSAERPLQSRPVKESSTPVLNVESRAPEWLAALAIGLLARLPNILKEVILQSRERSPLSIALYPKHHDMQDWPVHRHDRPPRSAPRRTSMKRDRSSQPHAMRPCVQAGRDSSACSLVGRSLPHTSNRAMKLTALSRADRETSHPAGVARRGRWGH
jgi:hypothetical protein